MRRVLLLLPVVAAFSCQPPRSPNEAEQGFALMQRTRELECRRQHLYLEVQQTWDEVSSALSLNLPPTMKKQERLNMVRIRNADLIRMFRIYPTLDTSIHAMVDQAEKKDLLLAQEIRQLEMQQQQHELELQSFLIEIRNQDTYRSWLDSMALARRFTCEEERTLQAEQ